jgi:hypothetical protein
MATAVHPDATFDTTTVPHIVRSAIKLGVVQAVVILAISLANRSLEGTADHAATAVLLAVGLIATIVLPGRWTHARTIEGIAGAAGIGLGAALAFLVLDVAVLQPLGTWTNRWYEVGGHSNWWYHPVWWMVGSYLAWMGAFVLANQTARRGSPSSIAAVLLIAGIAAVLAAAAATVGFPGAGWNVPTFGVAVLPALALSALVSGMGRPRG